MVIKRYICIIMKKKTQIATLLIGLTTLLASCNKITKAIVDTKSADSTLCAEAERAENICNTYNEDYIENVSDSLAVDNKLQESSSAQQGQQQQWNELAKYLVGMRLDSTNRYQPLTKWQGWVNYQQKMWIMWDHYRKNQAKASDWRDSVLVNRTSDCKQLLYAFSGPDWPYAHTFFPDVDEYIMLAAEPIGKVPEINMDMTESQSNDFANALYHTIINIWGNSFFVTAKMQQDLHNKQVDGVLPMLMMFMGRNYRNIESITVGRLCANGSIDTTQHKQSNALRMVVSKKGKRQTITYIRCDLSNTGLKNDTILTAYLGKNVHPDRCAGYLKAASYLMHYNTFSTIRNIITSKCKFILEDDSGIKYADLQKAGFKCTLWGNYIRPIDTFKNCYQKDLAEDYDKLKQEPLKFQIGYGRRFSLIGAEKQ